MGAWENLLYDSTVDKLNEAIGRSFPTEAKSQRGEDVIATVTVPPRTAGGWYARVVLPTGRACDVKIPVGVKDGAKLRLRGLGAPGLKGGEPGDALITVRMARPVGPPLQATPSARCSALQAVRGSRPTTNFTQWTGCTLHLVGLCLNRIGMVCRHRAKVMHGDGMVHGIALELEKGPAWPGCTTAAASLCDRNRRRTSS